MDEAWRDDPLTSKEGDRLGTAHVARRIAALVEDTHSFDSSTVIGLAGPWGSGKSSIAAMAVEELRSSGGRWGIARFTPWATSDVAAMMGDFYAALAGALPSDLQGEFRKKLGVLARLGSPALRLVPVAGDALSEAVSKAAASLMEQPSWDVAFNDAAQRMREMKRPVLVVVDDVDRLQHSELVALLRVVRLLGRFPGVSYLLAYDEQTLLSNLQTAELGVGSRAEARLFLEKVVQYSVAVPPLLRHQVLRPLKEGLDRIFDDQGVTIDYYDTRLEQLADVYVTQLRTPRSLHRFLAQVRFTLSLHDPEEIDPVDVTILTLLRVQFPELYHQLPAWRTELTGSGYSRRTPSRSSSQKTDVTELLALAPDGSDRLDAEVILGALFPRTTDQWLTAGTRQSVRESGYFDRYFVNAVHEEDIPDQQVIAALRAAQEQPADTDPMRALLTEGSPARQVLALRRMYSLSTEEPSDLDPLRLLQAMLSMTECIPERQAMFDNPRLLLVQWAATLISYQPEASVAELADALDAAPDTDTQLHVLWSMRSGDELPAAVTELARRMCEQALEEVLEHLRLGDQASQETAVNFRLQFIRRFGDPKAARRAIHQVLQEGVTTETLASRFVTVATLIGVPHPSPRLTDFDAGSFHYWAPSEDEFYTAERETGLDEGNLSWSNRRAYARGRTQPPQVQTET